MSDAPTIPAPSQTFVQLDDGRSINISLTGEGLIIDAFLHGALVGGEAMTYDEWYEAITPRSTP